MDSQEPGLQSNLKAVCLHCHDTKPSPSELQYMSLTYTSARHPPSFLSPSVDAHLPAGTYVPFLLLIVAARYILFTSLMPVPLDFHTCNPSQLPDKEECFTACQLLWNSCISKGKDQAQLVFVCCKKRHLRTAEKHYLPAKIRLNPSIRISCFHPILLKTAFL